MRLLLVRHGQTPSNVAQLLDTALPGPDLTDLGREQAEDLVLALADEPVDAVWASAAVRARSTAAPLARARGLDVQVREGLREVSAGDLEMRGDRDSQRAYLGVAFAWAAGDLGAALPGGESGADALARVDAVVAEVAASGAACAVLVSHGATIRMWSAARADDLDVDWVARRPLLNTGVVVLDGDPATGWRALAWEGAVPGAPEGAAGPAGRPAASTAGG